MLLTEWEGVELGMWAGSVLVLHPNTEWIKPALALMDKELSDELGYDCLIVTWYYKDVNIVLEIAEVETLTGTVKPYAVQKIIRVEDDSEDSHKVS